MGTAVVACRWVPAEGGRVPRGAWGAVVALHVGGAADVDFPSRGVARLAAGDFRPVAAPAAVRWAPVGGGRAPRAGAWLARGVLTAGECDALRRRAEAQGMDDLAAQFGTALRDAERTSITDAALADVVWRRLRPHVPRSVTVSAAGAPPGVKQSRELYGVWEPFGVNPHWRLVRYPGAGRGHFGPHADGDVLGAGSHERSLLTINGYLNPLPPGVGGATRFLEEDQPVTRDERGRYAPRPGSVTHAVVPDEAGMAVVFFHGLVHDGEPLGPGAPPKWIFRSEVMYRRDPATAPAALRDLTDRQRAARRAYEEAEDAEASDPLAAAELYRRAFKLDPELEQLLRER